MIKSMMFAAMACLAVHAGLAAGWSDDLDEAKRRAAESNKKILVVFSGSDWCGWCKRLDAEVLSKPEFIEAASRKYELVIVDSPRNKSILSEQARRRNPEIVKQYGVHGYPTSMLLDAKGNEIGRSPGFVRGGPSAYLKKIESLKNAPQPAAPRPDAARPTKRPSGATPQGPTPEVPNHCECGPECWEKLLCPCCKRNNGACCRKTVGKEVVDEPKAKEKPTEAAGLISRQVASWTVCTDDAELSGKVDETAAFLEEILRHFDAETSGYYRTMKSGYDGIWVHRDTEQRGKRRRMHKGKCYLNLFAQDSLRGKSWCLFFCDGFLSACEKEPRPDKEREAMLLYVGYRVARKMGVAGTDELFKSVAEEPTGMLRVLHELCQANEAAIRRYYLAKIQLLETDRVGPSLSLSDMAEMFSAAVGKDVFDIFTDHGVKVRKDLVTPKLKGVAGEGLGDADRGAAAAAGEGR